jgi:hypothetical protein
MKYKVGDKVSVNGAYEGEILEVDDTVLLGVTHPADFDGHSASYRFLGTRWEDKCWYITPNSIVGYLPVNHALEKELLALSV